MKHSTSLLIPQEQYSYSRRTHPFLILSLILISSSILISSTWVFSVMKSRIESESPAKNPTESMQSVCQMTPFPQKCKYAILIHEKHFSKSNPPKNISPSEFYSFLLNASLVHLKKRVVPLPKDSFSSKTNAIPAVKNCEVLLDDTKELIERSMLRLDETKEGSYNVIFSANRTSLVAVEFLVWIANATDNVESCIVGLEDLRLTTRENDEGVVGEIRRWKVRLYMMKELMENDLKILEKMDLFLYRFRPDLLRVLIDLLFKGREYWFGVGLFVSQYVMLVYLLHLLLGSHRYTCMALNPLVQKF